MLAREFDDMTGPFALVFWFLPGCVPVLESPQDSEDTAPDWVAPENSWPTAMPPDGLAAEGFAQGQVPPDFLLLDQYGAQVALWQFYGLVVVVDLSTMWCAPCRQIAGGIEETYEAYKDQGFIYLSVLSQNLDNQPPTLDDLVEWAEYYGITAPILSDDGSYTGQVVTDNSFPRLMVIDRTLRIANPNVQPIDDATVRKEVEAVLDP